MNNFLELSQLQYMKQHDENSDQITFSLLQNLSM